MTSQHCGPPASSALLGMILVTETSHSLWCCPEQQCGSAVHFLYLSVVCICMCAAHVWKSEDKFQELVLLPPTGSEAWTQAARLGGKHLYTLNLQMGPKVIISKWKQRLLLFGFGELFGCLVGFGIVFSETESHCVAGLATKSQWSSCPCFPRTRIMGASPCQTII